MNAHVIEWECPGCFKGGKVPHTPGEKLIDVLDRVVGDHMQVSTACVSPFDRLRIKLFD